MKTSTVRVGSVWTVSVVTLDVTVSVSNATSPALWAPARPFSTDKTPTMNASAQDYAAARATAAANASIRKRQWTAVFVDDVMVSAVVPIWFWPEPIRIWTARFATSAMEPANAP
jgi:hypothetical protein